MDNDQQAAVNHSQNVVARVVKLLDNDRLVINRGFSQGLQGGQTMIIFEKGEEITDPDTLESLGALELIKRSGRLLHVQEKLSIVQLDPITAKRNKTPSEIMSSLSGLDEDEADTAELKLGDYARPSE